MPIKFACQHCQARIRADDRKAGRAAKCPQCGEVLQVPAPTSASPPPSGRRSAATSPPPLPAVPSPDLPEHPLNSFLVSLSGPSQPDVSDAGHSAEANAAAVPSPQEAAGPAQEFAQAAGIELTQEAPSSFSDAKAWKAQKQQWQAEMPIVPSAYKPSGKLSAEAVAWLVLGSVAAVPAGMTAGVAVAVAGLILCLIFGLIMFLCAMVDGLAWIAFLSMLSIIVFALTAYVGMYGAMGAAAGWTVATVGRFGKNRNQVVPAILAVLSGLGGVLALKYAVNMAIGGDAIKQEEIAGIVGFILGTHAVSIMIASVLWLGTAGVAAIVAVDTVADSKFCERCETYLDEWILHGVGLGGARAMSSALADARIDVAADVFGTPRTSARTKGEPTLHVCPDCGVGYLELWVHFEGTYKEGDNAKPIKESWLAASRSLSEKEAELFKPHIAGKSTSILSRTTRRKWGWAWEWM